MPLPLIATPAPRFGGRVRAPGDKSISIRALVLGALAAGESRIAGLLESADVMACVRALGLLGVAIREEGGVCVVSGRGTGGLRTPDAVLDCGNSGTLARLLMGVLAGNGVSAILAGDASLSRRPMARVQTPLRAMGAAFSDARLPCRVEASWPLVPIHYVSPVASAQVKSAVLLAGLNTPGRTSVVEPVQSRDHTERMLPLFGVEVARETDAEGRAVVSVMGAAELNPAEIEIPGDASSVAFLCAAACVIPGAEVIIEHVGLNPTRLGFYHTLEEMGAKLTQTETGMAGGEPVGTLTARAAPLTGVDVPAARAASMIDEYPALAILAAHAKGRTRMAGLGELRIKESDRLTAIADGLSANGVKVASDADTLTITGCAGAPSGGGRVATHLDHRIAMAFLCLGLSAQNPVAIDDGGMIETSFPEFRTLIAALGGDIKEVASGAHHHD